MDHVNDLLKSEMGVYSLQEEFDVYTAKKANGEIFTAGIIRADMLRRIMKEEADLFKHPYFVALLSDEMAIENRQERNAQIATLLPLTKALYVKQGLIDTPIEDVWNDSYATLGDTSIFGTHLIKWTVLQLLGIEDEDFIQKMLKKACERTYLANIDSINIDSFEEVKNASAKLDSVIANPERIDETLYYEREVIRSCMTLYLLFSRIGEPVQAKFYLMQAVRLNYRENEINLLLLFLNKTILMNEEPSC